MSIANMFRSSRQAFSVEAGRRLFSEGDAGDVMYAVLDGEVMLHTGGTVIEVVRPGGFFGELALIDDAPRSASATARTEARVVPIDHQQFTFLVQDHPTFALQVMRVMADRLRRHRGPSAS